MDLPIGSSSPKSCPAAVWPRTQTFADVATSCCVKHVPLASAQRRMERYSGDTPRYTVFQFVLP